MSHVQRQALDAKLRSFHPLFRNRLIEQERASIQEARTASPPLMSSMQVPDGFRSAEVEPVAAMPRPARIGVRCGAGFLTNRLRIQLLHPSDYHWQCDSPGVRLEIHKIRSPRRLFRNGRSGPGERKRHLLNSPRDLLPATATYQCASLPVRHARTD